MNNQTEPQPTPETPQPATLTPVAAPNTTPTVSGESAKQTVLLEYILMGVGFFFPLTSLIAVIIAHVKRSDTTGTWLETHHRYLIRTFWIGLLGYVVGFVTLFIVVGWVVLIVTWLWTLYRVIKGYLYFSDKKPMYQSI